MKIRFEASFARDLKNIREKVLLNRIAKIIDEAKKADNAKQINSLKKLKGYDNFYRLKFGDYRLGIEIINNEIIFTRFLHRKEIYRYFP